MKGIIEQCVTKNQGIKFEFQNINSTEETVF